MLVAASLTSFGTADLSAQTYATPEAAKADPDFAIQGEYVGNNRGMQVVAQSAGDFQIAIYEGGLPGAGWDRQPPRRLDGDAEVVEQLIRSMGLRRTVRQSPTLGATPPPGATVLFDGSEDSLRRYWNDGAKVTPDGWLMEGVTTRESFGDYRLHVEFMTPYMPAARGQGRGNSGVYHHGRYETQVLDSFGLEGKNNETGGIYSIRDPEQNLCFPPLTWQTYDVDFTAPRFDGQGKKIAPARLTVRLNGVVVQNNVAADRVTTGGVGEEAPTGPIHLQDHGNPVRFRNLWIVPRDLKQEARRPIVAGFERFFGGTGIADPIGGRLLVDHLGCAACHSGESGAEAIGVAGPELTQVASRVRPEHLVDYIAAPHDVKPGTVMPDPWSGATEAERRASAEAIAQYLVSLGSGLVDEIGEEESALRGQEAYHAIGCVACHGAKVTPGGEPIVATGPDASEGNVPLGDLGAKYTLGSLSQFLADPLAIRPHGRMPKLAADANQARDLATYLLKEVVVVPPRETLRRRVYEGSWDRFPDFEKMKAVTEDRVGKLDVNGVKINGGFGIVYDGYIELPSSGDYRFRLVSDDGGRLSIDGKVIVDHDGIHPATEKADQVNLQAGVRPIKIEYFEGGGQRELSIRVELPGGATMPITALICTAATGKEPLPSKPERFARSDDAARRGKELFVTAGCVRCHAVNGAARPSEKVVTDWAQCRPDQGCLASEPPRGVPDYDLTDLQRRAIASAIGKSLPDVESAAPADAKLAIHRRMLSLNCYACHARDGIGGPEGSRRDYFQTTTPEMGDEGRLPPLLTGTGDKLNDTYLHQILAQGGDVRPYMKTRMPGFGEASTVALAKRLIETDRANVNDDLPGHGEAAANQQLAAGRVLAGNDGLACIKCHTFGGVGLPGIQAIDALQMPVRLRESWFHRYLLDPQKYRPGTRMPASYPDGKSVVTKIADGRPQEQSAAMWAYFSLGSKAKPPSGLVPDAIELKPSDRPLIYRNFLTGLSPRGIAVAYPQGVNLAWDATRMSLTEAWKNGFIDAGKHWIGRGPGAQEPLGDELIRIDSVTPIAKLEQPDQPWPAADAPGASPRFLGYRLDAAGLPTFRYSVSGLTVEDKPVPGSGEGGKQTITRTWRVTGVGQVSLLVAAGKVEPASGQEGDDPAAKWYSVDGTSTVKIDGGAVRQLRSQDRDELRVTIDLSPNETTATITQTIRW